MPLSEHARAYARRVRTPSPSRVTAGIAGLALAALALTACAPADSSGEAGASPSASGGAPVVPDATASAPATPEPSTAMACPDDPRPIDAERIAGALAFASRQLSAAAQDRSGYPVGALRGDTTYERTNARKWTAGFFPAELWIMAGANPSDPAWVSLATAWSDDIPRNAERTDTHDLGFLVGLPMAQAALADPANAPQYDAIADTAARSLATRWNPTVGAIQSGEYDGQWGVIVDSAMNMPLLIEAGQRIGGAEGQQLVDTGTQHLQFLAANFVREDGTTIHRQVFDTSTGANLGPVAGQGEGPSSTWARGQAWAVHGFADGYALTQDPALLDAAQRTAAAYMSRVPAGCIPTWDLDLVDGPADTPLDASAAAIVSDGLLALAEVEPDPGLAQQYRDYALVTLNTLANDRSLADGTGNPGILMRQTYNVNVESRSGSYVWGDAYLLLALTRSASG